MKSSTVSRLPVFVVILFLFFLSFPSAALSQAEGGSEGGLTKSPEVENFDQNALKKLREMTPQEVEDLDKKLAEALTLFYDREYARALPIFRDISEKVETMDILFWYASCAAKAGETDLSLKKFRDMLEIDPNLHRVRLELATVYFQLGKYKEARQELETVLEAKPPDAVKQNIEKLLASIEEKTKRWFTNLRGSLGFQVDHNISAGPDKEFIEIPENIGTLGPLTPTQRELRGYVGVINFAGNALYDMGERGDWMWNTAGSWYQTHNEEYYEFDFTQWRASTGPWWVGRRGVFKAPVGIAKNLYEHEDLYTTIDVSPSYEHFFTPGFSLRGMFSYVEDTYVYSAIAADDKSGQDLHNRIWEINPNFYLNNRNDILSFYYTDEDANGTDRRYTYDAMNLAASYFKRFNWFTWDMELYTRYKWTKKEYATPALLWPAGQLRTDIRHNFYMVLSRNFGKCYFAGVSFNWINNRSNTELYDYEKLVYGVNIGFKL
ncbi:MAG: tetratricopeptide repeat protein [Deltaproteobacteria bacterium]|nr:tetratricopeptide repeat protein [Deltaproteobacteria bacterium]